MSSTFSTSSSSREEVNSSLNSNSWPEVAVVEDAIFDNGTLQLPSTITEETTITPVPSREELEECLSNLPLTNDEALIKDQAAFYEKGAFSSFGDKGTTATVNTFGDILQISRYLGVSQAGFFCVDPGESDYHYEKQTPSNIVNRAQWLSEMSTFPVEGIGFRLGIPRQGSKEPKTTLGYINNRWPQFTRNTEHFDITIRYFAMNGAIIQKYLLKRRKLQPQDVQGMGEAVRETHSEEDQSRHNAGGTSPSPSDSHSLCPPGDGIQNTSSQLPEPTRSSSSSDVPPWPQLNIDTNFFIRTLYWKEEDSSFNKDEIDSDEYMVSLGPHDFSVIVKHRSPFDNIEEEVDMEDNESTSNRMPDCVALVMMPFVDGKPQKIERSNEWNERGGSQSYLVPLSSEGDTLDITMAYRLQLIEEERPPWKSLLFRASDLDIKDCLSEKHRHQISLSSSPYLDFVLNRNLEHILSVCSIPIPEGPVWDFDADGNRVQLAEDWNNHAPTALTCGDMSDHLLINSTGFFSFKFLIGILGHIQTTRDEIKPRAVSYHDQLVTYYQTASKHENATAIWRLSEISKLMLAEEIKPANRSREALDSSQHAKTPDEQHLLGDSNYNLHQKIDYLEQMVKTFHSCRKIEGRIATVCRMHLRWVFESAQVKDNQFLGEYWASGMAITGTGVSTNPVDTAVQILKAEAFDQTPKLGILTEATTRRRKEQAESWIQTLQRRDKRDFFAFGPAEYQPDHRYHLSDHVWIWTALRALADENLRISTREKHHDLRIYTPGVAQRKIQKRFSTENPVSKRRMLAIWRSARESSFRLNPEDTSLFYNGEFFVKDQNTQSPHQSVRISAWVNTIDAQVHHRENRDSEWSDPMQYGLAILITSQKEQINSRPAGEMFNVATNVLLRSCFPNGLFPGRLNEATKAPEPFSRVSEHKGYWNASFELPYIIWRRESEQNTPQSKREGRSGVITPIQDTRLRAVEPIMSITMPFKSLWYHQNFVDNNNLSEYSDPWLYKSPEFLNFVPPEQPKFNGSLTEPDQLGFIVYDKEDANAEGVSTIHHLEKSLVASQICKWRTSPQEALIKKRFIWMPFGSSDVFGKFVDATHDSEKQGLQSFFDRHLAHDKFFLDDPTAADNTWLTAFHLSFFKLCDIAETHPHAEEVSLGKSLSEKHSTRKVVRRGTLGFRLHGDFFDRYWTCYLVGNFHHGSPKLDQDQNRPKHSDEFLQRLSSIIYPQVLSLTRAGDQSKTQFWTQRKVLELLLFNEVLKEVTHCTEQILLAIKKSIRSRKYRLSGDSQQHASLKDPYLDRLSDANLFSDMDVKHYFLWSKKSQMLGRILEELEEDLSETISQIGSWERRERDRGPEQPRWTIKDEKRHRPALRKILLLNNQQIRALQQLHATVQSLKTSLTSKRDSIRDDLSLRGSEDVRYFTYVTVVFLPLGFAASIFSMSGAPPGVTLRDMAVTAVIALLVTTFALYVTHLYQNQKLESLADWIGEKWKARGSENSDDQSEREDRKPQDVENSDICLVELPPNHKNRERVNVADGAIDTSSRRRRTSLEGDRSISNAEEGFGGINATH